MGIFEGSIYGIMTMSNNYYQRVVDRTETEDWIVDTVSVTDRSWLYEVGVKHKGFNRGRWIIVDGVHTKEEAQQKHNEWVEKMKSNPVVLFDISEERYFRKSLREDN